jgi:1-acyl-sn-glycerol-3-phosphate acyltransferase
MNLELAHQLARKQGANPVAYWVVRAILQPFFRVYFRLRRIGTQHIPRRGPVLLASNHRSFCDPFMIGLCLRRPLRFFAKAELFDKTWKARLLLWLGAFPVRREESDEMAIETARIILEQGGAVGIFCEGTRVRPGPLGEPKRGVGRLALETGAPVVPVAIAGTEDIRKGWRIRPRRVNIRCGRSLTFPRPLAGGSSPALAAEITRRVWSCVSLQWEWLGGMPPVREVAVVGAGSWGTAVAILLARAGVHVQLACRTPAQARELTHARVNSAYLPGVELPPSVEVGTVGELRLEQLDLLCLAVPSGALPAAIASLGQRLPEGLGVLSLIKGLVGPDGALPSAFAGSRLGDRPVACLGGPAHAREAVGRGAHVTVASTDSAFAARVAAVFSRAGLTCETSTDLVGVELAGSAKNVAALAAAATLPAGANAAGAAAGLVYAECFALASAYGARPESFAGLAGTGDLVATVLASQSRNRRAGELLAGGMGAGRIAAAIGQVPEALDVVPVLAAAMERVGVRAPATEGLAALVEGRIDIERWLEASGRSVSSRAA